MLNKTGTILLLLAAITASGQVSPTDRSFDVEGVADGVYAVIR